MDQKAEQITDKKIIFDIFKNRFIKGRVFFKSGDLNIQINDFDFDGLYISVHDENISDPPAKAVFYVREIDNLIYSTAELKSVSSNGRAMYEPTTLQILNIPRKEERKSVPEKGPAAVYISNIISDFKILESFQDQSRRLSIIKNELLKKFNEKYPDSDIFFMHERQGDPRMQFFRNNIRPLYIKELDHINDHDKVKESEELKHYKLSIFPRETNPEKNVFCSEISVPLLYKLMMPFGYIKTFSRTGLTDTDLSVIRKFGMSVSTIISNDQQLITGSEDRIAVTDLSTSGLAVLFRNRLLITYFKEGSSMLLTLYLPDNSQAVLLCTVKNISIINTNVYRVGCAIENIEAIGEANFTDYLESLD